MLRTQLLIGLALGVLAPVAACGSTDNGAGGKSSGDAGAGNPGGTGADNAGASNAGAPDGGAGNVSGSAVLPFTPSNIDLVGWDLSEVGDVDLSGTNCIIDDEEQDGLTGILCDVNNSQVQHKVVTLSDKSKLSIYVMKSLRIEASTVLSLSRGHLPIVIVATGEMELLGSIDAAPGQVGGAFNNKALTKGVGPGGGTTGDSTGLAGGGASFCGLGGKAGTSADAKATKPAAPTPAYGAAELIPLLAGSAGGNGGLTSDGTGGGALQLVAGTSFTLHAGAYINAGGGGGSFGGQGLVSSGGGGSGGAILIESPIVKVDGAIGANGGGGGQGNGDTGEDGQPDVLAKGGHQSKGSEGPPGGDGSFDADVDGATGVSSTDYGASGGGGGAGRIRINTTSGAAKLGTVISPAPGTACFSEGKLTK